MSNLPDKIKVTICKNALSYATGKGDDHSKDAAYHGYIAGATEWAGKAKELADALKWIQMHAPIEPVVDDAISAAIAKYKEVGND